MKAIINVRIGKPSFDGVKDGVVIYNVLRDISSREILINEINLDYEKRG
jgi:hypothetical protein